MSFIAAALAATAACLLAAIAPAFAGSYAVAPVTVRLSAERAIAEVTVENRGEGPLRIETRTFAWTQDSGEDQLEPTREVIAFPPVFVLQRGEAQVVRLAWRGRSSAVERAYRLRLDELPNDASEGNVQVMVRQVLPVFFEPGPAAAARAEARIDRAHGEVHIANRGSAHLRALALRWYDAAGTMLAEQKEPFYILAGAKRAIALPRPPGDDGHDARILKLQTPTGEIVLAPN